MTMTEQLFSNCKFGYPGKKGLFSKEESFECHRFPVMAGASGGIPFAAGIWPIVTKSPFWCGEWKKDGT
jgi:hypothetical protein